MNQQAQAPGAPEWSEQTRARREAELRKWLTGDLKLAVESVKPASSDASFRRYFRVWHRDGVHIAMDAPPEFEDCRSFLTIAWTLRDLGLSVPEVLEMDMEKGFLLLTDLGDRLYLDELGTNTVEHLYGDALDALETMQVKGPRTGAGLPPYDRALLLREMNLFRDWLVERHAGLELSGDQSAMLDTCFELLCENALAQPQVFVHRDYHSRNLMVLDHGNPGILDFQDAVIGPITYDLVSLLRDCYISWPRAQVEQWALDYRRRQAVAELVGDVAEDQWLYWFDLMGVQRHLKASGIFARLNHRDGKPRYLDDIPRTLRYILQIAGLHHELEPLHDFIALELAPRLGMEV